MQMRRSLKQVDVKQLYNPVLQEVRVSWRSEFGVCYWSSSRENQTQQRAGPSGLPVEQPRRMRNKCCYSQKSWGSICCSLCSVSNSPLTDKPFVTLRTISNKVWEVYFSKELCFVRLYCIDYVSAYIGVCYNCFSFNAKSCFYILIKYMLCKHIL